MLSQYADIKSLSLPKIVRNDISFPMQFATSDIFHDFNTAISEVVKVNINLLDQLPLPQHLQREDISRYFENNIISDLKQDALFERSVKIGKYAKDMFKSMESYFNEIFDFHEDLKKELQSSIFFHSKMFLNSDLPLSFIKTLGDSLLTETDYLNLFDRQIRKERLSLLGARSNRPKFERICESHNSWVKEFGERLDAMENERVKLIWYVDIYNSKTIDEIFKAKFIKKSSLNLDMLFDMIMRLQKQTQEMEKLNNAFVKEFHPSLSYENDAARTLLKMMHILKS